MNLLMDDEVIKWKVKAYKKKGPNSGFLDQKVP